MRDDDGRDNNVPTGKPPRDTDSEREKLRRRYRREKKFKVVPVRLGPDLLERLEREVERRDSWMSTFIRRVLADYAINLDYPDTADDA